MNVKFGLHPTPRSNNKQGETQVHARIITNGTKQIDDICEHINDVSTLSSSDIKAVLEALFQYISYSLKDGYNVELDGLGSFSLSARTHTKINQQGKNSTQVTIDGVNFRASERLRKEVKYIKPVHEKRLDHSTTAPLQIRKQRMINHIRNHGYITVSDYAHITNSSYYLARKDIKQFHQEGILLASGKPTHRIYLLPPVTVPERTEE